jgi:hypothetical protein
MSSAAFLNTICRGIVGHVSYLATCSLSPIYSEYLLYEPIARIGQSKGYIVRHERPVGSKKVGPGDHKRIDFHFAKRNRSIALEVKWCQRKTCNVTKDVEKLQTSKSDDRYLLVFGPGKIIDQVKVISSGQRLSSRGRVVRWNAGKTDYAARWFGV